MGQLLSRQSPFDAREEAHNLKTDPIVLEVLRENIVLSGRSVTLFPSRGYLNPNRLVYSGDLSADPEGTANQIRPLLCLEYNGGEHSALVRHGITGEALMMIVREPCDVGFSDGGKAFSCSCGGETEARLYANGTPVAVNVSQEFLNVAPASQEQGGRPWAGSSMVELVKHRGDSKRIHLLSVKTLDGTPGHKLAAYSKVANSQVSVFKMLDCSSADPLATLVMAWFTSYDNS